MDDVPLTWAGVAAIFVVNATVLAKQYISSHQLRDVHSQIRNNHRPYQPAMRCQRDLTDAKVDKVIDAIEQLDNKIESIYKNTNN